MFRPLANLPASANVSEAVFVGEIPARWEQAVLKRFPKASIERVSDVKHLPGRAVDVVVFGVTPEPVTASDAEKTASAVMRCLERSGYLFVTDTHAAAELLPVLHKGLSRQRAARFDSSGAATYRHLGAGTLGDRLPEGYRVFYQNKAYLERDVAPTKNFFLTGKEPTWGSRWHYGPMWFEKYYGDDEPMLDWSEGPKRLVMWQTLSRLDVPKGWRKTRFTNHTKQTGFTVLDPSVPYERTWSSHARRHRAKWEKIKEDWEVFEPELEPFIAAYKDTKFDPVLKFLFIDMLREKVIAHGKHMRLFAIRKKGDGNPIIAGFAASDIPEEKQSKHFMSFIHQSAKQYPVGTALMDEWFRYALDKGYRFLDFGVFWAPGDPPSWKGFSKFKAQFGIFFLKYPLPLVRTAGSWRELLRSHKKKTPAA